jgi:hypothetical protein
MTILKKLKTLYIYAFHSNKWQVALQGVEQSASGTSLFQGQSLLHQPFSMVRGVDGMTKEKCNRFREGGMGKLDPELEHPPPAPA